MRISSFARKVGFSADSLRQMERHGRIPAARRDHNGHRRFTEDDVARLRAMLLRQRADDRIGTGIREEVDEQ